jgi:redox-sensitive bicupin YhaK (pirin superfamily)
MTTILKRIDPLPQQVGTFTVSRMMPQREMTAVGSFVFLDYFDNKGPPEQYPFPDGSFAHPHRGISTLTYLLHGELTHIDSQQHQGKVNAGGVQWMKAGTGIVHDEWPRPVDGRFNGLQFWITSTPEWKAQPPAYKAVSSEELPTVELTDKSSLKVVVGKFNHQTSPIPTDTRQELWHLQLSKGDELRLPVNPMDQVSVFLAEGELTLNGELLSDRQLAHLIPEVSSLAIRVHEKSELFVFGGEPYQHEIVSGGPFVMNTAEEMEAAYRDYKSGLYGEMDYSGIV